jgi:hypothetical protein
MVMMVCEAMDTSFSFGRGQSPRSGISCKQQKRLASWQRFLLEFNTVADEVRNEESVSYLKSL